jgi:glucosamine-6-phosphate deaminase
MEMRKQSVTSKTYDSMRVYVLDSNEQVGLEAANHFTDLILRVLRERDRAAVVLATGNSQLTFMSALRTKKEIPWGRVLVFHMDAYLGMSDQHSASFSRYIREKLVDYVHPAAFYPMIGDAADANMEMKRYAELLRKFPPDICVLGIGENGHLAFNDPPADFQTKETLKLVTLDHECRMQQVHEGHFPTIDDVPRQAITLTVPALLSAKHVLAVVPEERKAKAVKAALEGPVTPNCPSSILRTKSNVEMFLDRESASLLIQV